MKYRELPSLWAALEDMGIDNGWHPNPEAWIPGNWEVRCRTADEQISRMTDEERETFVMGEEMAMKAIEVKYDASVAYEVLNAAFDGGPLTNVQVAHTTAVEHVDYENGVLKGRRQQH